MSAGLCLYSMDIAVVVIVSCVLIGLQSSVSWCTAVAMATCSCSAQWPHCLTTSVHSSSVLPPHLSALWKYECCTYSHVYGRLLRCVCEVSSSNMLAVNYCWIVKLAVNYCQHKITAGFVMLAGTTAGFVKLAVNHCHQ